MAESRRNLSLKKKSSARLAAVQCLYKGAMLDQLSEPARLVSDYTRHLSESRDDKGTEWVPEIKPQMSLLAEIVEGVCSHTARIDGIVKERLHENWSLERMGPLLVALLRAAVYELMLRESAPSRAIVDEYVTLAEGFFGETELAFVNALLHQLSVDLRES